MIVVEKRRSPLIIRDIVTECRQIDRIVEKAVKASRKLEYPET
jgi:hypothetical protein